MNANQFDPVRYKATTRDQWEAAAEAWDRWTPVLQRWLGPGTEQMLDLAGVGPEPDPRLWRLAQVNRH